VQGIGLWQVNVSFPPQVRELETQFQQRIGWKDQDQTTGQTGALSFPFPYDVAAVVVVVRVALKHLSFDKATLLARGTREL